MENSFDIKQQLNKIADYIIQKYPDSCLAHNGKDDFRLQEDIQNFFFIMSGSAGAAVEIRKLSCEKSASIFTSSISIMGTMNCVKNSEERLE